MINTLRSVPSQKAGDLVPVSTIPVVNTRQTEINSIAAKSPMKQISFNIRSPANTYTQPIASISSPQPIRSTVYNNMPNFQVEKTPVLMVNAVNRQSI